MTADEVVQHFGSIQAAAEKLGLSYHAVYYWVNGDKPITHERQCMIQVSTEGVLKAGKRPRKVAGGVCQ